MIVDTGNIIVNIFDATARRVFAIEEKYRSLTPGQEQFEDDEETSGYPRHGSRDPDAAFDQWLEQNPLPAEWIERLERDEEELER